MIITYYLIHKCLEKEHLNSYVLRSCLLCNIIISQVVFCIIKK